METGSPRKIQFTVPLLDTHLDPEAAEQIRRRRPTPATLVASSDQSSPEIDEDRLPNQLYKAALLNSPRQRRKGQKGTPTMKELQFLVEHHLYRQQQGAGDECSSESCLSDRPSPDSVPTGEELPHDDEATAEAFEKLRCQMEGMCGGCQAGFNLCACSCLFSNRCILKICYSTNLGTKTNTQHLVH
uniref:Protein phosphatase 1 regulatory subunit 1A n=1 Tax=Haplochromis burtoni TaxID=8153 RepID=A0A3Q2VVH2_HAPBU